MMWYDLIYEIWYDTIYDVWSGIIWYMNSYSVYELYYVMWSMYVRTYVWCDVIYVILLIWYNIWYFYGMIYLLTAIGLTPGGSSTVHIYTQKQYAEQHNETE